MIELLAGYLRGLSNANHFGVVTQIDNNFGNFETENQVFIAAATEAHRKYMAEDEAYKRTQKDWNVDRLKAADEILDDYMIALRAILAGYAALPDGEEMKQPAKEFLQLWKDFDFKTNDSYSGETSKVLNILQEVHKKQSQAEALGVWPYFIKAAQQAQTVQGLLDARFNELSSRTVGELKAAREATDAAIKQCFVVLNSLQVLMPSNDVTALCRKLKAIEDYAKQYYLKDNGNNADEGDVTPVNPDGGGSQDGGGDVTPVTPENGGSTDNPGSSDNPPSNGDSPTNDGDGD